MFLLQGSRVDSRMWPLGWGSFSVASKGADPSKPKDGEKADTLYAHQGCLSTCIIHVRAMYAVNVVCSIMQMKNITLQ